MAPDDMGELQRRLEAAEARLEATQTTLEGMRRDGEGPGRRRRWWSSGGRTRPVVLSSVILGLLIAPFGIAATGDVLREGVRNGTTGSETEIIGKFDASSGEKGGYVTRQSNTQTGPRAGGAAIYGCRGAARGTAGGSAPCLRASNLANGFAFEFAAKSGPAGLFEVGSAADAPFATNGGGVVANLNADKVDGLDAAQLRGAQGPAGPAGAAGAKGDTGAQGPPGVTATAGAKLTTPVPLQGTNTVVDSAVMRTTVTLPRRSRIMATASGQAEFTVAGELRCQLVLEQPPTFFTGNNISEPIEWPAGAGTRPFAATGSIVAEAGEWQVGLHCTTPLGAANFTSGDLVVWAAGE